MRKSLLAFLTLGVFIVKALITPLATLQYTEPVLRLPQASAL